MMTIPEISEQITFLYTADLQQSAHFYETILGLPMIVDQGSCRVYRIADGGAYLGVCEREVPGVTGLIFTFVTPDVDAWYARIISHDYACESAPAISEQYGIYHFFVKDPAGYLLEFQRFLDPNWNKTS